MDVNREASEALELDSLKEMLAGYTQSALGRHLVQELNPSFDEVEISCRAGLISECVRVLEGASFGFGALGDVRTILEKLRIRSIALEPNELLALLIHLELAEALRSEFNLIPEDERRVALQLGGLIARIGDFQLLAAGVRRTVLPGGEVDDRASPELRRIRQEIASLRTRILDALERQLEAQSAHAAQDDIITIRNDRYVIPIRADLRAKVPGVVHGISSSGHTVFIEPLATIESNNDLVRLRDQEQAEIERILAELTNAIASRCEEIAELEEVFARLDYAFAMARFSREYSCTRPALQHGLALELSGARHPLLERKLRQRESHAVPVSLKLEFEKWPVMIISGPNAGGKTVTLKTVGLAVWMAHAGLHVPAGSAQVPLLREMLVDIGDHQSVEASLSTFTAHLFTVREMLERAGDQTLALLDEVGSGTDPDEGAALGEAIIDHFQDRGAMVLATTHAPALKMHALSRPGVQNASVEFDERTLSPTFRLMTGAAGTSKGIEIARRVGIPEAIIQRANSRRNVSERQTQNFLAELKTQIELQRDLTAALEEERQAVAARYAEMEKIAVLKEAARDRTLRERLRELMEKFERRADQTIEDLKRRHPDSTLLPALRKSKEKKAAALAREFEHEITSRFTSASGEQSFASPTADVVTGGELQAGDRVLVRAIGRDGVVQSVSSDAAEVLVGALRMRLAPEELVRLRSVAKRSPAGSIDFALADHADAKSELNLVGCRVEEARERTDKYLDEAALSHFDQVRIIHGYGSGALRSSIRELLKSHPHVESYAPAPPNEGGDGATIVELRK